MRTTLETSSVLRWVRLCTLVFGCIIVVLVLRRSMPTAVAIAYSVVFSLAFLAGLRIRAAVAHARNLAGKELSWSAGLLSGFFALIVVGAVTRTSPWPVVYCAAGFETLVGYAIGKATCAAAGCCNASPPLPYNVNLPTAELIATLLLLAVAAAALAFSPVDALYVMVFGHLLTRCASRYLRTARLGSLLAPDIAALTVASAAVVLH